MLEEEKTLSDNLHTQPLSSMSQQTTQEENERPSKTKIRFKPIDDEPTESRESRRSLPKWMSGDTTKQTSTRKPKVIEM